MRGVWNVVICGVGGQGVVSAGRVLADAALRTGMRVRCMEIVGGAQRGGAVSCHVRFGEEVHSPLVPDGSADVIIGIEPVEAVRISARLLRKDGIVVVNETPVYPITVQVRQEDYPSIEDLKKILERMTSNIYLINASEVAMELGGRIAASMILLGLTVAVSGIPIKPEIFLKSMEFNLPRQVLELNIKAFRLGFLKGSGGGEGWI